MRTKQAFMTGVAILAAVTTTSAVPGGGTVSGKVTYEGTPAKQKPIDMSKEPSCAKQYATPPPTETVVTGPNNALENVVVYISAGAPDEPPPSQPAVFTQKGCRYIPHVLALQVNQPLQVLNEDQTSHNIHPLAKMEFIPVKCNVHPWMHGTFAVLKNSHYSISGGDGGFSLPNLPPGKYTVSAYHESYGDQSQEVTIAGSETKTVNFVFKAKPY